MSDRRLFQAVVRWLAGTIVLLTPILAIASPPLAAQTNSPVSLADPAVASTPRPPSPARPVATVTTPAQAAPVSETSDKPPPTPAQSTEARQLGVVRGESDKEGPAPAGSFSGSWVLQTLSALAIVLALVFLVRTVMQRLSGIKTTNGPHGMIEVLGHWPVGPRTQVVLLRVMDRVVVAAQSSSGMDHLLTIEEPNEVASLLAQVTAERGGTVSNKFQRLLQNVDRLYQGQSVSEEEEPRDLDEQYVDRTHHAMSGLLSRMRRMQSPDA